MNFKFPALLLALSLCLSPTFADMLPPKVHSTAYPLKDMRVLLNDAEIAVARENVARYKTAQTLATGIINSADIWMAWEDTALRKMVPTADVPRAFNVGTAGCPQCGAEIYAKGGTYPWILDPETPFKVKCPLDGSVYPDNDFAAYYDTEMNDTALLTGDYADDGRGWVDPHGERYWFVAYSNHWMLMNHIIPAVRSLSRAYILTGDKAYARKAVVLLDRFAEVYPNMDYHVQSRYGQLEAARGGRYEGKIVNHIWETGVLATLAESYDYCWDAIDDQTIAGKSSEAVRRNIEANLLDEGIREYFTGKIRGNFGMHQKALVYAGLARQYGQQDLWFDALLNKGTGIYSMTGLNYALYNLVYRDGTPYETSPGYNFSWVVNLTTVAVALEKAGYPVFETPKVARLYDAVLDVINVNAFTPSLGDSGGIYGGLVGLDPFVFQSAWRAYGDEHYIHHLQRMNAVGEHSFNRFESLFSPPVDTAEDPPPQLHSRLLDGYGMAILNNPDDTVSLSLYYGYKGGHGHFDRLHFEIFANNKPMTPDTGYPDFMNAYVPGIYSWSKNTIAHNTLTVDASRQQDNHQGTVHLFADKGFARALDVDALGTYPTTTEYRRRMLMIDFDAESSYIVDSFDVAGGTQHDYSLHGPPGTFRALDGAWSAPAKGTLAGEEVPLGYLYDNPKMAQEDYTGSYGGYSGSGFQHLEKVQRLESGHAIGEWVHEKDEKARIRIHLLDGAGQDTLLAEAQVSPVKHKQRLQYMIARRQGEALESSFSAVLEPFSDSVHIDKVIPLPLVVGEGRAMSAYWRDREGRACKDVILINTGLRSLGVAEPEVESNARFTVLRYIEDKLKQQWSVGGSYVDIADERYSQAAFLHGKVQSIKADENEVLITLEGLGIDLEDLSGKVIHFNNPYRRTAHTIQSALSTKEGIALKLQDDLRVGHVRITTATPEHLTTETGLAFASVYQGAYVCNSEFKGFVPLKRVHNNTLEFAVQNNDEQLFLPEEDAWIVNVAKGDLVDIPLVTLRNH